MPQWVCASSKVKFYNNLLFGLRDDRDIRTGQASFLELDSAVTQGIQRMVSANADILARVVDGATLTDDNVAGNTMLTAKNLNA